MWGSGSVRETTEGSELKNLFSLFDSSVPTAVPQVVFQQGTQEKLRSQHTDLTALKCQRLAY